MRAVIKLAWLLLWSRWLILDPAPHVVRWLESVRPPTPAVTQIVCSRTKKQPATVSPSMRVKRLISALRIRQACQTVKQRFFRVACKEVLIFNLKFSPLYQWRSNLFLLAGNASGVRGRNDQKSVSFDQYEAICIGRRQFPFINRLSVSVQIDMRLMSMCVCVCGPTKRFLHFVLSITSAEDIYNYAHVDELKISFSAIIN